MRVIRRDGNEPDAGVGVNGTSGRALSRKAPVRQHPTAAGFCVRPPKRYSSRPALARHRRLARSRRRRSARELSHDSDDDSDSRPRRRWRATPAERTRKRGPTGRSEIRQRFLAKRSRAASCRLADAGPVCGRLLAVAGEHAGAGRRESSERTSASAFALRYRKT